MSRFSTLVLGTAVGVAALGLSATASAGVRFGVDVAVPVPVPAVVAPAPVVSVGYRPVAPYYYGPHYYAGAPYHRYWGPAYAYPRYGWHGAYYGHVWHR